MVSDIWGVNVKVSLFNKHWAQLPAKCWWYKDKCFTNIPSFFMPQSPYRAVCSTEILFPWSCTLRSLLNDHFPREDILSILCKRTFPWSLCFINCLFCLFFLHSTSNWNYFCLFILSIPTKSQFMRQKTLNIFKALPLVPRPYPLHKSTQ